MRARSWAISGKPLAFNVGEPNHDLFECLRWIASCLTEEEIEVLAKHYSAPPVPEE